nr:MAG TPA: hypothetical protein [Caudoviricetes sp.]
MCFYFEISRILIYLCKVFHWKDALKVQQTIKH